MSALVARPTVFMAPAERRKVSGPVSLGSHVWMVHMLMVGEETLIRVEFAWWRPAWTARLGFMIAQLKLPLPAARNHG
jgi:hypothetical protein